MRMGTAACAVALLAAGCGSGSPTANPTTPSGQVRPASTGRLRILEPKPGTVVTGTTLTVKLELTGARLVKQASTNITPDTGHIHFTLDGKIVTLLAGLTYELTDLTPGRHILQAEFVAADHSPFNPRVIETVTFTVE
jgi:hypothetical protein